MISSFSDAGYPWARGRDAGAMALTQAVKAALDPDNLINPGALGI